MARAQTSFLPDPGPVVSAHLIRCLLALFYCAFLFSFLLLLFPLLDPFPILTSSYQAQPDQTFYCNRPYPRLIFSFIFFLVPEPAFHFHRLPSFTSPSFLPPQSFSFHYWNNPLIHATLPPLPAILLRRLPPRLFSAAPSLENIMLLSPIPTSNPPLSLPGKTLPPDRGYQKQFTFFFIYILKQSGHEGELEGIMRKRDTYEKKLIAYRYRWIMYRPARALGSIELDSCLSCLIGQRKMTMEQQVMSLNRPGDARFSRLTRGLCGSHLR
jgi:hypothetical protein